MLSNRSIVWVCSLLGASCSAQDYPTHATGVDAPSSAGEAVAQSSAPLVTNGPSTSGPSNLLHALGITPGPAADPQIIGGAPAAAGSYPWQVTLGEIGDPLQLYNDSVYPHFCGGSVISENWVVTAGHCMFGVAANSIAIKAGVLQRSAAPDSNIQIRGAKSITLHPNYTDYYHWQVGDDIALIELNEPLKFTSRVRPVALANVSAPDTGNIVVSGWGRTDGFVSAQSDLLNAVQLPIRSNATCNASFTWTTDPVNSAMMCAGSATGSIASCNGDSGGPVVYRASATDSWRQVGIVSWGQTNCVNYSVFTRVSNDYAWVKSIVPSLYRNGDLNRDGCVNSTDVSIVQAALGGPPPANNVLVDTNNDGTVNSIDYLQVVSNVTATCP